MVQWQLVLMTSLACSLLAPVNAWGHVFSRFSPELLEHYGFSGSRSYKYAPLSTAAAKTQSDFIPEEREHEKTKAFCRAKRCFSNEQCCQNYLCVDVASSEKSAVGRCLREFDRSSGDDCNSDADCAPHLMCVQQVGGDKSCSLPPAGKKLYFESCRTSMDCDVSRGLCCQLLRKHRRTPRKACTYFSDSLMCIGHVPIEQIKSRIDHMEGEKRITGDVMDLQHLA